MESTTSRSTCPLTVCTLRQRRHRRAQRAPPRPPSSLHSPDVVVSTKNHAAFCVARSPDVAQLGLAAGALEAAAVPVAVHGVKEEAVCDFAPAARTSLPGQRAGAHRRRLAVTPGIHHCPSKHRGGGSERHTHLIAPRTFQFNQYCFAHNRLPSADGRVGNVPNKVTGSERFNHIPSSLPSTSRHISADSELLKLFQFAPKRNRPSH